MAKKITEAQLKQLIRESLDEVVDEYGGGYYPYDNNGQRVSSDYTNRGGWDDDYNDLDAVYRAQNARHMEMGLGNLEEGVDETTDEGFLGNLWGGVKNAAQSTGQGIAQRANKLAADYNAGAAQNAQKDINAQIQKSQQIIAKEQEKINNLRAKYNQYVQKSDKYTQKANANAQNRGSNTRYQGYGMQQDTRNQDFFSQGDMNKAKFSSRMAGAKQAHRKMRNQQQPQEMVAESRLDRIIRESIKKYVG